MDTPSLFLRSIKTLPPMMQSVLSHEENGALTLRIADDHDLSREQRKALVHLVQFVILQQVRPQDVPERVEHDLQLGREEAKRVACDLLGWRFLAMEWYIGPVQPVIRNLGGDPEHYLPELREIYPEVFLGAPLFPETKPDPEDPMTAIEERLNREEENSAPTSDAHLSSTNDEILDEFLERLGTESGRAEILLRLTGLSSAIEERMDTGSMTREIGEGFLERLESVANAIETRDMNPLEMQSLRRRMQRILEDLTALGL